MARSQRAMKHQVSWDIRGRMAESCADMAAQSVSAKSSREGRAGRRRDALISSVGGHWERLNPTKGGEWRSISERRHFAVGARKWIRIQSSAEQSVAQRAWEGSRSQPCQQMSLSLAGGARRVGRRARRVCREGWEDPPEGAVVRGLFAGSRHSLLPVGPNSSDVSRLTTPVARRAKAERRCFLFKRGQASGGTQVIMSGLY